MVPLKERCRKAGGEGFDEGKKGESRSKKKRIVEENMEACVLERKCDGPSTDQEATGDEAADDDASDDETTKTSPDSSDPESFPQTPPVSNRAQELSGLGPLNLPRPRRRKPTHPKPVRAQGTPARTAISNHMPPTPVSLPPAKGSTFKPRPAKASKAVSRPCSEDEDVFAVPSSSGRAPTPEPKKGPLPAKTTALGLAHESSPSPASHEPEESVSFELAVLKYENTSFVGTNNGLKMLVERLAENVAGLQAQLTCFEAENTEPRGKLPFNAFTRSWPQGLMGWIVGAIVGAIVVWCVLSHLWYMVGGCHRVCKRGGYSG